MNQTAQRLDALIDRRRLDLGLRWKDVADTVGVTQQTLLEARKGRQISELTAAGIERFMNWKPGSVARILDGSDPIPEEADVDPLAASAPWGGELRAPEAPLQGQELLRWRQVERGRLYRLDDGSLSVEYTFGAEETPVDVIDDLRDLLDQYRVNAKAMERRRARR
ncbi:hypothetical protein ABZ799_01565 [Nocardiopsis dassonvillei]|uniref:hypothetical protein n=1 Tax=Nocardiopsis dassonvillei TaxID=2014 RepID=UPI0033C1ADAC